MISLGLSLELSASNGFTPTSEITLNLKWSYNHSRDLGGHGLSVRGALILWTCMRLWHLSSGFNFRWVGTRRAKQLQVSRKISRRLSRYCQFFPARSQGRRARSFLKGRESWRLTCAKFLLSWADKLSSTVLWWSLLDSFQTQARRNLRTKPPSLLSFSIFWDTRSTLTFARLLSETTLLDLMRTRSQNRFILSR